jgi:archaellum component FlaF (FlaF/FlaG flagellin family)
MTTLFLILLALLVSGGIAYLLMKSGKIKDANNNNIPDAIEEKIEDVKEVVEEVKEKVEVVKQRAKRVKEEVADVVKATKKVVEQAKDVTKAAKGSTRKGAKRKTK